MQNVENKKLPVNENFHSHLGMNFQWPDVLNNNYGLSLDYTNDARDFEEVILRDGEKLKMPRPSASDLEKPLHMEPTGTPKQTPGWYRVLLAAVLSRHALREYASSATNIDGGNWFYNIFGVGQMSEWLAGLRDNQVNLVTDFFNDAAKNGIGVEDLVKQDNYKKVLGILESTGHVKNVEKTLADAYEIFDQVYKVGDNDVVTKKIAEQMGKDKNFFDGIKSQLKANHANKIFDTGIGILTTAVTVDYAMNVYNDIHRCLAEVAAYEKYDERKKASDINPIDLFTSENNIIKDTRNNFIAKNALRGAVCAGFFGRWLGDLMGDENAQWLKGVPFGMTMLGGVGVLMLMEVTRKDSTLFDDITELRDHKLNPQRGMSSSINASDLFDLYQKYSLIHHPDKMFKDATRNDHNDEGRWLSARAIFDRMAEMMNHTYKYKDPAYSQNDHVLQVEQEILGTLEYFTLPKFIYLLGRDMIDFDRPELTLACAEIANTYSIQAAKQFWHNVNDKHIPIEVALQDYVVDLSKTLGGTSAEITEISKKTPLYREAILANYLDKNPEIHDKYDKLLDLREQMQNSGRTPELLKEASVLVQDVRNIMDKKQDNINEYGEATPINAVNNIVNLKRLRNPVVSDVGVSV